MCSLLLEMVCIQEKIRDSGKSIFYVHDCTLLVGNWDRYANMAVQISTGQLSYINKNKSQKYIYMCLQWPAPIFTKKNYVFF